jgi:uncharacterized delta-60 repeat protein
MSFKFNQDLSGAGNISNFTLYNSTIYAVSSLNSDIYTIEYDGDTGTFLPATILDVKLETNGGYIASDDNYIWMTDGEKIYKLDPTDDNSTLTNSGILSDFNPFAITANSPDFLWVLSNNSSVCKFVSINKNDMTIQSPINTATPLSIDTTLKLAFNVITSDSSNNGWIFYPTTHESQPKLRLSKFSSNGSLLLSTNVSNNSLLSHMESGFDKSAFGIATNNENVYAMFYDSIYKFNMNGNLISTLNPILNTQENLYGGLSITSKYLLTCIYNFFSSAENNYRVCFIDIDTFTFNKVVYIGSPCNNPSKCKTINADENNIFVNSRKFINGNYKEFISVLSLILKPGDLDNTFGTNGLVTTDFNGNGGIVSKMKIDSSNRIVVAGYSTINGYYDFALARYDNSGNLDSTFGTGGLVTTDFSGHDDIGNAIAIDSSNRIVVAGFATINENKNFALARYDNSGNLDATFGQNGLVTTDFSGNDDTGNAIAIDSSNRIVVAGFATINGNANFALARYDNSGNLDATFGQNGLVSTDFSGNYDTANAIAIDSSNRIVVAGFANINGNTNFDLARYDNSGNLDATFGQNGLVTTDFSGNYDTANAMRIDSSNRIIVSGSAIINGNTNFALARYDNSGNLDATFGQNGLVTTDFSGNYDTANAIAIDSLGRIIVAGSANINDVNNFALARYDNSGNLDSTFGTNGLVNTNFSGYADSAYEMQIDSLGRIIVAGSASINDSASFALARYIGSDVVTSNGSNNSVLCFKEDTKILCFVNDKEEYLPIQDIRRDTLVKTYSSGYKKVDIIGTKKMYNPGNNLKSKDRLYKCTKENYPEITEDLIITGCHSILTNHVTVEQRKLTEELMGNVYVTENHHRLPACVDDRAEPYTQEGVHNIWHIALEHSDYYMNYGIYANGLLVETTSKRMLKELSGMDLL